MRAREIVYERARARDQERQKENEKANLYETEGKMRERWRADI